MTGSLTMDWDFSTRRLGFRPDGTPIAGGIAPDRRFRATFRVEPQHIDEMGHVNNAVWLLWLQDIAAAHWYAAARDEDRDRLVGIVLKHEIDYRANVGVGAEIIVETWIDSLPQGLRCTRMARFTDAAGKLLVATTSQWGMLDRETGRLARIGADVVTPFLPLAGAADPS
ncbi:acyl-CoA thioesterase [Sphingomonas montanisoli]|nr:acyl-CoA thioesterase [Sphingomonas montanisoli]